MEGIEDLVLTDEYGTLRDLEVPFDMFRAMGRSLSENDTSFLMRFLMDSNETHRLGVTFLKDWLTCIFNEAGDAAGLFRDISFSSSSAVTEWVTHADRDRRVDLRIDAKDSEGNDALILGVENKHWAAEQPKQVSDYQTAIAKLNAECPKAVLFLTPDGRNPESGDFSNSDCPWIPCSYKTVLEAISMSLPSAQPEVATFLKSLKNHLAIKLEIYEMLDGQQDVKNLVLQLFKVEKHRTAILAIERNRPRANDLANRILRGDSKWGSMGRKKKPGSAGSFETYPSSGEPRELKWFPHSLECSVDNRCVSIAYMLTSDSAWNPGTSVQVAVLAWCEGVDSDDERRGIHNRLDSPWDVTGWWWSKWAPIWVGKSHTLEAMQDDDSTKLIELLNEAFEQTHGWLQARIGELGWSKSTNQGSD